MSVVRCPSSVVSRRSGRESARSPFRLPPSPFRLGISLTEVLIAMGIMMVGLLSVASIFPVGSWYLQKAMTADQGSAIAQSVMSDLMARGWLNTSAWFVMTPSPSVAPNAAVPDQNWIFGNPAIDGRYTPSKIPAANTFTRPFAEALAEGLKVTTDPVTISKQFGSAFVIDPLFVATRAPIRAPGAQPSDPISTSANNRLAYAFPATSSYWTFAGGSGAYYCHLGWTPWKSRDTPAANTNPSHYTWPIRRVTFQQASGWPVDVTAAESYSRIPDDLAYDFPERPDRPSKQSFNTVVDTRTIETLPLSRKWTGDYSWLATVVPTSIAARDALAAKGNSYEYDVSVVVFHKRAMPSALNPLESPASQATDLKFAGSHERAVGAAIISTGVNGGELLLTDMDDNPAVSAFTDLRTGQWIMLCGPHPNSSLTEPRFVLNWYQVLAIDKDGSGLGPRFDPTKNRVISVRGPQWPWQPATTNWYDRTSPLSLSNDLCVGIFKGAVAVHTKTLRLESPLGGSFGTGSTVMTPSATAPGVVTH